MKVKTIKQATICTGQVKAAGVYMDLPKTEAERLIKLGVCISLEENQTKPKTTKKD
tara:strand:- start:2837 stop:3004 length:168 start_codon:yes stop_codon:yes gene_type:complete